MPPDPHATAALVLAAVETYEAEAERIPLLAQRAFEARDWPVLVSLSHRRLALYGEHARRLVPALRQASSKATDDPFWHAVEGAYAALIEGRYEADLAHAFFHSARRLAFEDAWRPVSYAPPPGGETPRDPSAILVAIEATLPVRGPHVAAMLDVARFGVSWRDRAGDTRLVAIEINRCLLRYGFRDAEPFVIEMVDAGFFRNRGACLIGRVVAAGRPAVPLLIAILNGRDGPFVDAVLSEGDELQHVFSSTLANFHVTTRRYHELAAFLHELMPKRPLGTHYSTIGFNHVGKAAVMNDILAGQARTGERLDTALGFRGTVAIGFSMPSSRYVLKVIRDTPTAGYKWGAFAGVASVIGKYRDVHETDRAGSMLDNILYSNVALARDALDPALLDEMLAVAAANVSLAGETVRFRHLIVQVKLIPLPLFLERADAGQARQAVVGLGDCIKNNAATNIFNRDLDARNYGLSAIGRVHLFDYDAVERLTDVKVRTNAGREDGEEDVADWFFEDGTVFLPEEILLGLRIDDSRLRRVFREAHPELMTIDYWEGMQRALRAGKVPAVRSYPASRRLHRHALRLGS